jgi:hypothetical protein
VCFNLDENANVGSGKCAYSRERGVHHTGPNACHGETYSVKHKESEKERESEQRRKEEGCNRKRDVKGGEDV